MVESPPAFDVQDNAESVADAGADSTETAASDMEMVQLLIAVSNITESAANEDNFERQHSPCSAAERLLRAIKTVMTEKQRQFIHYRLQWLIFENNKPQPQEFKLPEGVSSPRGIHDVDARERWWRHARDHADIVRKHREIKAKSTKPSSVPSTAVSSPRPRRSSTRKPTFLGRDGKPQGSLTIEVEDEEEEEPGTPLGRHARSMSAGKARSHRESVMRHVPSQCGTLSGSGFNAVVKQAAHAASQAHLAAKRLSYVEPVEKGRCGARGMSPTGSQRRPSLLQSVCALEKGEVSSPTREKVGLTTQELLAKAKRAREATQGRGKEQKASKRAPLTANATATHSEPTVFLTSQPLQEAESLPWMSQVCRGAPAPESQQAPEPPPAPESQQAPEPPEEGNSAEAPEESDGEGGQADEQPTIARNKSAVRRRCQLTDSIINAAGGLESTRLSLHEPLPGQATVPPMVMPTAQPGRLGSKKGIDPSAQGKAACRPVSSSTASTRAPSATPAPATSSTAVPSVVRDTSNDVAPANQGASGGLTPFPRPRRGAGIRANRNDQLYVQNAQTMQAFETLRGMNVRYDVTRTMTGIYQEEPLPMAPPGLTAAAMAEWKWRPGQADFSSRSLASRPSSAPNLGQLQRNPPGQHDGIGDKTIAGLWGPCIEKECLPVPPATRKVESVASRQASIDNLINSRLDSRTQTFRWGTNLREKARGSAKAASGRPSSAASSVPSTASASAVARVARPLRCPSAPSRPISAAGAKPGKPACAQACKPPQSLRGPASGEPQAHAYLEKVSAVSGVPAVFKVLQDAIQVDYEEGDPCTPRSLDIRFLNLSDKEAAPILTGLEMSRASFSAVLLNGNPRLTDATFVRLLRLVSSVSKMRQGNLKRLDLSGAKGMHEAGIKVLAKELVGELREIQVLSMEGIAIPERVWPELEAGIGPLLQLEELCLANTQVGRESQRSAVSVAEMLLGLPMLRNLDISGNFFNFEGCKALASCLGHHRKLAKLDMSHNAGGFVQISLGASRSSAQSSHPPASTSFPRFNPISLVCESVAHAKSLKVLNLANCQLNYDEDFVLEVALAEKVEKSGCGMVELDLSGNPCQGAMGARCLVRMVVMTPSLHRLDVGEFREALPPAASIPYEFCDPSCHFQADLSHPQHRAVLRMILQRCKSSGESVAKVLEFPNKPLGEQLVKLWSQGESWPEDGQIEFACTIGAVCLSEANDIAKLINTISLKRKLKVSLWSFVRVAELFRNLKDDEARRVLIAAMASDLLLKLSHVRCLSEIYATLRIELIERLLPAVHPLDRMGGFDTFMNARGEGALPLHINHKSTLELLLFNAYCPNAHYHLHMNCPSHRRILEQLLVVNEWERALCKANGHCDLSQHGDHEALRNVLLNAVPVIWNSDEAAIPSRGELMFDYCSPFHPAYEKTPVQDAVLDLLIASVVEATVEPWPKLEALRTCLHNVVLAPEQCGRLIEVFPDSQSTFASTGSMVSLRVDAFVALYARCHDIGGLLSSERHGLYGLQLLSREEVLNVRSRLGRLRTWDIMNADSDCVVPGMQSSGVNQRKAEGLADRQKIQRTLDELRLRDDPTSFGLANRYCIELEKLFEDWMFAVILMEVNKGEDGEHFDAATWSEKAHLEEKGSRWLIPEEWKTVPTDVPKKGTVTVTFCVERDGCKDQEYRKVLAAKYLGW